jgi:hypothetical protein
MKGSGRGLENGEIHLLSGTGAQRRYVALDKEHGGWRVAMKPRNDGGMVSRTPAGVIVSTTHTCERWHVCHVCHA